jgi:hypothetical protein
MHEAAERTVEDTWRRLGACCQPSPKENARSQRECADYLKNSGYAAI